MTNRASAAYSHREPQRRNSRNGNRLSVAKKITLQPDSEDSELAEAHDIVVRNLKYWMERKDLSSAELARRLEKAPSTISQWFRGQNSPELATLGEIARILGIPVSWLLVENNAELPAAPPRTPQEIKLDDDERYLRALAKRFGFRFRGLEPIK